MSFQTALQPDILKAAQMTAVYSTMYYATFVNTLITKKRLYQQCKAEGKEFERYSHPGMHSADRLNLNFLEWTPVFLGPLWSLAATGSLSSACVTMAWSYLGLRALYAGLVMTYGVSRTGQNKPLWISTFPAYACLLYLQVNALNLLFKE